MRANKEENQFPYTLDDTPLMDTSSTSYLGVELDILRSYMEQTSDENLSQRIPEAWPAEEEF